MEVATWIAPFIKYKSALIGLGVATGSLLTLVGGAYAMRYSDPLKEVRAVRVAVDSVKVKVDSNVIPRLMGVERGVALASSERDTLKRQMAWLVYLACRREQRDDPNGYPADVCTGRRPAP